MQALGSEPVYVISVAARLAGLPCWVLRVLDQEGIVVPVRTDSNRRLYSDNDITLLARVRHLTEERHVNIAGVKVILEIEREHQQQHERQSINPEGTVTALARVNGSLSVVETP
jgi:MerR family transcriptional regulator/heat shock protein HspR